MSDTPENPDCVPDEFPDLSERTITIELGPNDCHLVMAAAMQVSMAHAFHGCDRERIADDLLARVHDAIGVQIKGL